MQNWSVLCYRCENSCHPDISNFLSIWLNIQSLPAVLMRSITSNIWLLTFKKYHRARWNSICLKFINQTELCSTLSLWENWFTQLNLSGSALEIPKYLSSSRHCFRVNCSKFCCIDILFFNMCHRLIYIKIHKYLCICLRLVCIKSKWVLHLDKTGYVSHETRPKFIDSQNIYFQFHDTLFCMKALHLSDKLSLTCRRLWPKEDTCIRLYVIKRLLNEWHI